MIRGPQTKEQRLQRGESQRIFAQTRRFFAPASLIPAPLSQPQMTGGRNTVLTAQNSANAAPTDSATLRFQSGGTLTWYYTTKFKKPPNVTATPIGKTSGGATPSIHLHGPGSNVAVIIDSADSTDDRLVQLHAIGAPN